MSDHVSIEAFTSSIEEQRNVILINFIFENLYLLNIVVAQINRYTFSVCWLTRIQLLAFIPSSVPVAIGNVRVSAVSVNSSSLNYHDFTYDSFVVCVDLVAL